MSFPWRIGATASNKPTAAQAYQIGSALAGHRAPTALTDGDTVVLLAQSADRATWEIYEASVYTAGSPGTFSRAGTLTSSSGSAIDWSATGEDETPELHVLGDPRHMQGEEVAAAQAVAGDNADYVTIEYAFKENYVYQILFDRLAGATSHGFPFLEVKQGGNWLVTDEYIYRVDGGVGNNTITRASSAIGAHIRMTTAVVDDGLQSGLCGALWMFRAGAAGENTVFSGQVGGSYSVTEAITGMVTAVVDAVAATEGIRFGTTASGFFIGRVVVKEFGPWPS